MSIVKPCPYDINGEHCKYEIYYGEPIFSKCKNCSRTRTIFKRCIEMTDEEMAGEYAKLNARQYIHNDGIGFCTSEEEVRQAYLAGLKAGRPKWHKVADGDLPKHEVNVLVLHNVQCIDIAHYNYDYKEWHFTDSIVREVIAWCEIPKYTEVEK